MSWWRTPRAVPAVETPLRRIATRLPVPESLNILEKLHRFEPLAMRGQPPVVWHRAEGFQVHDAYGNCWIGYVRKAFVEAISRLVRS